MIRQMQRPWLIVGALFLTLVWSERAVAQCEFQVGPPVTAADGLEQDEFGASVAIDVDTAIMGAPGDDHAGDASGSAYVFIRSGAVWTQQAKLIALDADVGDRFGFDVANSGNIAFVGAPGDDFPIDVFDAGSVYVFNRAGTVWTQGQKLAKATPGLYEEFGRSVAMDTTTAFIGAPFNTLFREESGSVFVYIRSGLTWSLLDNFGASDNFIDDGFGHSVALSGSTAVVGNESGAAYVFLRTGDTWNEQQILVSPDGGAGFGLSVAVRGDVVLIGAPLDGAGSAYVFTRTAGVWTFQQKLTAPEATAGFGNSVAMETNLAVVGASLDDTVAGVSAGATYLFVNTGGVWSQEARVRAGDAAAGDEFGSDVAVSTGRVLVGARFGDNAGGVNSGSAYVFAARSPDCNANGVLDACDITNGTSADCNGNNVPDECDLADGTSLDCNANGMPDECDIVSGASADCNANGIPDECEVDCNANGVPDDCDIRDGTSQDCNANAVPDSCDIAGGFSQDCNVNGVPDECECVNTMSPVPEPGGVAKSRYVSFVPGNPCVRAAIRVTYASLPAPFGGFIGQHLWVGPPHLVSESSLVPGAGNPPRFAAAELQCAPYYTQWESWGTVSVSAADVVPGARYAIQMIEAGCDLIDEGSYSGPLNVPTAVWGDVTAPVNVTNFTDIFAIVVKFQDKPGAVSKPYADLQPNIPNRVVNFLDVSQDVAAFQSKPYPFSGPCACPSTATCPTLDACGRCSP